MVSCRDRDGGRIVGRHDHADTAGGEGSQRFENGGALERASSSAVGSSASTSGAPARYTCAKAARCCSPPESSPGQSVAAVRDPQQV